MALGRALRGDEILHDISKVLTGVNELCAGGASFQDFKQPGTFPKRFQGCMSSLELRYPRPNGFGLTLRVLGFGDVNR